MSVKWMSYIWEERLDLKGAELSCAIAIADHADADGNCFPGIDTIAQKMRCSERHAQDLIHRLEAKKVFKIKQGNGRGIKSVFEFIKGEQSCTLLDKKRVNNRAEKGEQSCKKRVNNRASPPTPPYKDEPLIEPNINQEEERESPLNLAVEIYQEIYPTNTIGSLRLSELENRLPAVNPVLWRQVLKDWQLDGYKSGSISKMIDCYEEKLGRQNNKGFAAKKNQWSKDDYANYYRQQLAANGNGI